MSKVVIIEDNEFISNLYVHHMVKLGLSVVASFVRGEDAVKYLENHENIDLLLMDIELAGEITGIEAARQIRLFSYVPILFISGCPLSSVAAQINDIDESAFTPKIFDADKLSNTIQTNFPHQIEGLVPV